MVGLFDDEEEQVEYQSVDMSDVPEDERLGFIGHINKMRKRPLGFTGSRSTMETIFDRIEQTPEQESRDEY